MKNFKNYLCSLTINDPCFKFLCNTLDKNYSFELVQDLFSLPCIKYETQYKLAMIFKLLEDGEINDTIITWLAQILNNINEELWQNYEEHLNTFIEKNYYKLSQDQFLKLAHTIELMYANGYNTLQIIKQLYQRIPLSNVEFSPDSDINVRIKLAKIAYNSSKFNINESLFSIEALKQHLKKSGHKHLLGMVNYYKGLCLKSASYNIGYKDATYYIMKSRHKEFELAYMYLNYRAIMSETSKNSCNAV